MALLFFSPLVSGLIADMNLCFNRKAAFSDDHRVVM